MDYRLIFLSCFVFVISWGGTAEEKQSPLLNLGPIVKAVEYWKIRILRYYLRRGGISDSSGVTLCISGSKKNFAVRIQNSRTANRHR